MRPAYRWGGRPAPRKSLACLVLVAFLGVAAQSNRGWCADRVPAADGAPPAKVYRYAQRLIQRYDHNGDGKLQADEWRKMHGDPARADANSDGVVSVEELVQWIVAYGSRRRIRVEWPVLAPDQVAEPTEEPPRAKLAPTEEKPAGSDTSPTPAAGPSEPAPTAPRDARFHVSPKRLPDGLPSWFRTRDADGDGQLTLSEFAPQATAAQRAEFSRYDLNHDGVVTPQEYLKATKPAKPAPSR
jgi:hypothetical protein